MRLMLLLIALLVPASAWSEERPAVERLSIPGIGRLAYVEVFQELSAPGESLDAFALRVGPRLRAYSDETGFEACGAFAKDESGRWGIVVGSNQSHIACAVLRNKVPAGMRAVVESIHSHGVNRAVRANKSDLALMGQALAKNGGVGRAAVYVNGQTLDAFSQADLHASPGYLAIPGGRVLFQAGTPGSIREIAPAGPDSGSAAQAAP